MRTTVVATALILILSGGSLAQESAEPVPRGTSEPTAQEEPPPIHVEVQSAPAPIEATYGGLTIKEWTSIGTLFIVLCGLILTRQRLNRADKTARTAETTAVTALKQVETALRGQLTERFAKAVEMLSDSESLMIRLGGIHALASIAHESKDDHWPVMEVLCAFLRVETTRRHEELQAQDVQRQPADEDIQAALDVLRHRKIEYERSDQKPNLGRARLEKRSLTGIHLEGADLSGAHLEKASLMKANLKEANLMGAHLEGAHLSNARLQEAVLLVADLTGATLVGVHLHEALMGGADLESANLMRAHLEGAYLGGARLKRAKMTHARLEHADLGEVDFEQADLSYADLHEAHDWELITSISGTNIHGVKNAPEGFVKWALDNGAVQMVPARWREHLAHQASG